MAEWFECWFGEEYLRLYPHRDDADAEQAVQLIAENVAISGRHVLDLGCGSGRHASLLVDRGASVVGLDLSMPLLARAQRRVPPPHSVVRGDMRQLPFGTDAFDLVVNLFTSFGYFSDDDQHAAVLRQVSSTIVAGGGFVLDYLNADHVRDNLVPSEELEIDSQPVRVRRRVSDDEKYVIKEMYLTQDDRQFRESVRLFSARELEVLLADVGLRVQSRYGAYDGRPLTAQSPRTILFAER